MKTIENPVDKKASKKPPIKHWWLYDTEFDNFQTLCGTKTRSKHAPRDKDKRNICQVCQDLLDSDHWLKMIKDKEKYDEFHRSRYS